MSGADELLHQIKHGASQQAGDDVPVAFGHIASYDPKLHRVRLVVPSWRDEAGNAVLTSWMPITTAWGGNGFGMQFAPLGGATVDNPTQGEPCVISIIRKNQGVSVQAGLFFNQANTPPFTDLEPGEGGMKAKGGSFVRFKTDKSIVLDTTAGNANVVVNCGTGQAQVNCDKAIVTAVTEIDLTAPLTKVSGNLDVEGALNLAGGIHALDGSTYTGDLKTSGNIYAQFGTGGQVGLATHNHTQGNDGHGDSEQPTAAPTAGS